jgi:hypothetical protein
MAASNAGLKSATRTRSNGGTPPAGPTHNASNGLRDGGRSRGTPEYEIFFSNAVLSRVSGAGIRRPAILLAGNLERNAGRLKCGTPDLAQPIASFRVWCRGDNAFALRFEG